MGISVFNVFRSMSFTIITQIETPGVAAAISLYNGLAYVADSEAGLQMINYLALDSQGQPPTIDL